jgi:hypothetical protein
MRLLGTREGTTVTLCIVGAGGTEGSRHGERTEGDTVSIVTLEGIVEGGQVRLPSNVRLPDRTKVYVIVPGMEVERAARIFSPRLARPEEAADFVLEVIPDDPDASL